MAGYRLGAGAALPPLLLDDEEAVAVAIGLRAAATGSVAGIEESSVRALTKLEQVLPSRLRHRVKLLQSVAVTPTVGATVEPEVLLAVAAACRDHQRLRFDYRSHDGTSSCPDDGAASPRSHRAAVVPGRRGTWTATTGAPSAWTGWPHGSRPVLASRLGSRRSSIRP